jgi:hypothetical protein
MKNIALLLAGMATAIVVAMSSLGKSTAPMFEEKQAPSKEIKIAATDWKLPASHKTEWAIFGSG